MTTLDTILASLRSLLPELSPAQDAGIAGNLMVESGLNPSALNRAEGAIGIAQWEGGRRTALQQYAAATNGAETDLKTQLAFLASELKGSESGAYSKLLATSDPASAAAIFDQYYERSSGSSRDVRVADAQAIASGQPVTAGNGGNGSIQLTGLTSSVAKSTAAPFFTIGLKILGGAAAAGMVILGASRTINQ